MARRGEGRIGAGLAGVIVAGNIIGSAVYALPATMGAVGSISIIAWGVATVGAFAVALVISLLAAGTADPEGLVGYVGAGLGRFCGFAVALMYWTGNFVANLSVAIAIAAYASVFAPALEQPLWRSVAGVAALWAIAALTLVGPRSVGRFGIVSMVAGLAPVLLIATLGWISFDPHLFAASWNVTGGSGFDAVRASVVAAFWAFTGLETGAVISAVVRNPGRDVPIATLSAVALAALVYLSLAAVVMGLAPAHSYALSSAPLALAARRVGGPLLAGAVAICALIKASGTLAGLTLSTAEAARAGADAHLFPGRLPPSPQGDAPRRIIIGSALAGSVITALSTSPTFGRQYEALIDVATVWTLIPYVACALAVFRLTRDLAPGPRRLAWALAVVAAGVSAWVAANGTPASFWLTIALGVLTVLLWIAFVRRGPGARPQAPRSGPAT
ncbi:MAG TPA: amino acid permease [Caulobacteraceae bacterium]|nr:amino acid permease [Caulobacteraceae bacterium]